MTARDGDRGGLASVSCDFVALIAPTWPTCQEQLTPRCRGIRVGHFDRCLAHLAPGDLEEALARLGPGVDFDARGVIFDGNLFSRVLHLVTETDVGGPRPRFGPLRFDGACFRRDLSLSNAVFDGDAVFDHAQVHGVARFRNASFGGAAAFSGTHFDAEVDFEGVHFYGGVSFTKPAHFHMGAIFARSTFDEGASFDGARFLEETTFQGVSFAGDAWFGGAQFEETVTFTDARFKRDAWFADAHFDNFAYFGQVSFGRVASFQGAAFGETAEFRRTNFRDAAFFLDAKFGDGAGFGEVKFGADTVFDGVNIGGRALFRSAMFEKTRQLGPLVAAHVQLAHARFSGPVKIELEAGAVECENARFDAGVTLRTRYAAVSLRQVALGGPSSLTGPSQPFRSSEGNVVAASGDQVHKWDARASAHRAPASHRRRYREQVEEWVPSLMSLQGTDVSELVLADVDMRWCRFTGAHHLDLLHIEGRSPFHEPPTGRYGWLTGQKWPFLRRWTSRRVIAEEHAWRIERGGGKSAGWQVHPQEGGEPVRAEQLAVLYRSLRKALEDSKDEAGAGDFYYGEMEARRATGSPRDKFVLGTYWLLSGYGQRALRAIAGLATLVTILTVLLWGWGLPADSPPQLATGTVTTIPGASQAVILQMSDAPVVPPTPTQRWTADRAGKAVQLALGSVVFRDTAQKLTATGTWTIMVGRFLGPVLLALAVLAIRARIKR